MILVTGGTGFVGSHLVRLLARQGRAVRCLVRSRKRAEGLPVGVEPALGDLVSGQGIEDALAGVDLVYHLAGVTKALGPEGYWAGNARATRNLLQAMHGRVPRLVHVSSLAAIGPGHGRVPVSEDDPPQPLTHYGRSKLEAERIVRSLAPDAVIARPPVVYGPGDTDVFQVLKAASRGLLVQIAGPERWFSAIYVEDLAAGLAAAAEKGIPGQAYFLSHAKAVTWSDLGLTAARLMGRSARVIHVPQPIAYTAGYAAELWQYATRKPGIVSREKVSEALCPSWVCDTSRAARDLNFLAPTGLEEGLSSTLAWYKEKRWLTY